MIFRSDKENLPRAALSATRGVTKTCHRGKLSVQSNDELKNQTRIDNKVTKMDLFVKLSCLAVVLVQVSASAVSESPLILVVLVKLSHKPNLTLQLVLNPPFVRAFANFIF